jgi:hypothetical protein
MQGYQVLQNIIPSVYLRSARQETLRLKKWLLENDLIGKPSELGTGTYWRGIETASRLSSDLERMYKSNFMRDLARAFLGDEFYYFNDQVVVKMPHEDFAFEPHYDNQYGQDPQGQFETINFTWILDDQDKQSGAITFKTDKGWVTPEVKSGDILVIDGNQVHASTFNRTNKPRRNWCCVYSKEKPNYLDFYSERVVFNS